MKSKFCSFISLLCICILLLNGCKTAKGYPEFIFDNLSGSTGQDYLISEDFEYLRVGGCAIIPQIKVITHSTYAVSLFFYTTTGDLEVLIEQIELLHNNEIVASKDVNLSFSLNKPNEDCLSHVERVLELPTDDMPFKSGDKCQLRITVTVYEDAMPQRKTILFDGKITQYTTIVFPV